MAGKLITLPLRVWIGSARLLARAAGGVATRAVSLAGQTVGVITPDRRGAEHAHPSAEPPPAEPASAEPAPAEPPRDPRSAARPDTPLPAPAPTERKPPPPAPPVQEPPVQEPDVSEPVHVSQEPELVREMAEPGAEDGAGAAVTIMEPWNGYQDMSAREVIERAEQATRAELAAVRLYESRHRSRQTVLAAVDRQLKVGNGGDPA